jgi:hypothetical protein
MRRIKMYSARDDAAMTAARQQTGRTTSLHAAAGPTFGRARLTGSFGKLFMGIA